MITLLKSTIQPIIINTKISPTSQGFSPKPKLTNNTREREREREEVLTERKRQRSRRRIHEEIGKRGRRGFDLEKRERVKEK
ncbi:hypothetical protein GIB67_037849, partial [Kingdonia uniflora]